METVLLNGDKFDVKNVTFQPNITRLSNGSKHIGMGYKKKIFTLQIPLMNIPFGINCNDKFDTPKYSLDLSFDNKEDNKELKKFYNNFVKLDKLIINQACENSVKWFKLEENTNKEVIKELYNKQIKKSLNKKGEVNDKYPARIRIKIPYDNEKKKFLCDIVNEKGQNIEENIANTLIRGSKVKCIIQCVGLWIANNSFSCQWKIKRMECYPYVKKPIVFLDDSESE